MNTAALIRCFGRLNSRAQHRKTHLGKRYKRQTSHARHIVFVETPNEDSVSHAINRERVTWRE